MVRRAVAAGLLAAVLAAPAASETTWVFIRDSKRDEANTFLQNHPELDWLGGGNRTFDRPASQTGTGAPDAWYCAWSGLELLDSTGLVSRLQSVETGAVIRGWKVNTVNGGGPNAWHLAYYRESRGWTLSTALADTTRKPWALVPIVTEP